MKADIHPNYTAIKVTCSCGNEFTTRSTLGEDLLQITSRCLDSNPGPIASFHDSSGRGRSAMLVAFDSSTLRKKHEPGCIPPY